VLLLLLLVTDAPAAIGPTVQFNPQHMQATYAGRARGDGGSVWEACREQGMLQLKYILLALQGSTKQHRAVQTSTRQYKPAQGSTKQHKAVQSSTQQHKQQLRKQEP
jgi:hypothetical protein